MANTLSFMNRELTVAMAGLDPVAMQKQLVAFARQSVAEVIAEGRASAPYETFVNGRPGPVESVRLPGPVTFVFNNYGVVIRAAIEELQRRVPRRTGRYAASFMVLVNQVPTVDFSNIPPGAEIIIFNAMPYTRRMETGANKTGARHFDLSKAALNRRFNGVFQVQMTFLNISAGVAPGVPYVLRQSAGRRKDRQADKPITYPALIISAA